MNKYLLTALLIGALGFCYFTFAETTDYKSQLPKSTYTAKQKSEWDAILTDFLQKADPVFTGAPTFDAGSITLDGDATNTAPGNSIIDVTGGSSTNLNQLIGMTANQRYYLRNAGTNNITIEHNDGKIETGSAADITGWVPDSVLLVIAKDATNAFVSAP